MKTSVSREELEKLEAKYNKFRGNNLFQMWRNQYIDALNWYNGSVFMEDDILETLRKTEVIPISCNVLATALNVLLGIELQNEYRIKVIVTNQIDDARNYEEGLNEYFLALQNKQEFAGNIRSAFKDCLIGGLGFVKVDFVDREVILKRINPLNIVFDMSDETLDYGNQYTIFTWEDLRQEEIKYRFYKSNNYNKLKFHDKEYYDFDINYNDLSDSILNTGYHNRVYTIHRITIEKGWRGFVKQRPSDNSENANESLVKTINKNVVEEISKENRWSSLEETMLKVYSSIKICQGHVLESTLVDPVVVDEGLPIAIMTYNQDSMSFPKGFVSRMKKLQGALNVALSRVTSYANTEKVFIRLESQADREEINKDPSFIVAPNAVVTLGPNDSVEIVKPNEAIAQQTRLIEMYLEFFKKESGIEDESKGIQTNATSGIAQQQRDIASMRANAFLYDSFKRFKKKIGTFILQQLSNSYENDIIVHLLDNDEKQYITFNKVEFDNQGNPIILNGLDKINFNITIQEAPAHNTSKEQKRLDLQALSQSPLIPYILKSKTLMGYFFENPAKILKEIKESEAEMIQQANK